MISPDFLGNTPSGCGDGELPRSPCWGHQDPRDWVRAVTASRRQGITHWHPDWAAVSGLARGHGEAHENWRTAMAAIEATGDASLGRGLYVWTERERVGPSQVAALLATIS